MGKRKKTTRSAKSKKQNLSDGRGSKILGMTILAISVCLFFAMLSYLFSWKVDFNQVQLPTFEYLFGSQYEASNLMGKLGAKSSHWLIYSGIGIMAFPIVILLGRTGLLILLDMEKTDLWRQWRWLLGLSVFVSTFFAFVFSSMTFNIGGNIGQGVHFFLKNLLGPMGLSLLFLFVLAFLIVWLFNPNLNFALDNQNGKVDFKSTLTSLSQKMPWNSSGKAKAKSRAKTAKSAVTNTSDNVEEQDSGSESFAEILADKQEGIKAQEESLISNNPIKYQSEEEFEIVAPTDENDSTSKTSLKEHEFSVLGTEADKLIVEKENIDHLEPYDPKKELSNYTHPSIDTFRKYGTGEIEYDEQELKDKKDQIVQTLANYSIEISSIMATVGPTVTLYEIVPKPGVKISKIKNLEDDIALSLAALGIRIIAPIPGRGTIGIEVPNKKRQIVGLRELLESKKFQNAKMDLPIALGRTISAEVFIADLAKMPHLLVAGATGQGKSVGINTILASILYKKHPSQVKLVLIDPKKVELSIYAEIENHFLAYLPDEEEPIITETKKVINTLNSLCIEMDDRYNLLKKGRARNIKEYNEKFTKRRLNPEKGHRFLPFIVLVIDEFADLIMTAGKEIELPIGRLAQLARAVGIHLIIATQRPSVNIITGLIKANFPARLAFKVTSKIDSRTILDTGGADQLVGMGDMLLSVNGKVIRLQCAFVDTPEVEELVDGIASQKSFPTPYFLPEFKGDEEEETRASEITASDLDDFFDEAARLVVGANSGSTSMIQRKMKLGYNRAGRIMDQMEHFGIVGPGRGSKPREVMIHSEMELNQHLKAIRNMG